MNPEVLCYLSKTFSNFIGEYLKNFLDFLAANNSHPIR